MCVGMSCSGPTPFGYVTNTPVLRPQQTYAECIEVLATICRTISLATLSLCFPAPSDWQGAQLQDAAGDYVRYYLSRHARPNGRIESTNTHIPPQTNCTCRSCAPPGCSTSSVWC